MGNKTELPGYIAVTKLQQDITTLPNTLKITTTKHNITRLSKVSSENLQWFSGFSDGEANFLISPDIRGNVAFRFRIRLHCDDLAALENIKTMLGVGVIRIESDSAIYIVSKLEDLRSVIIPIFITYPLLTTKSLDFLDFQKAIEIKHKSSTKKLTSKDLNSILTIKSNMNSSRKIDNFSLNTLAAPSNLNYRARSNDSATLALNAYWLLGFVEGEGTFGIKNLVPYFQVAQHNKSILVLNLIKVFLEDSYSETTQLKDSKNNKAVVNSKDLASNSSTIAINNKNLNNVSIFSNKKTNVSSLVVSNIDTLFYSILPLFDFMLYKSAFFTRKLEDYKLWAIALKIHKLGYFYLAKGRSLLVSISKSINKNRYSTNPTAKAASVPLEKLNVEIESLFSQNPPLNLNNRLTHTELSKQITRDKGGRYGFTVYVYKNGTKLEGSPFNSYSAAHQAIGLKGTSRAIGRNIDTGKLFKGIYLFSSTPC